MTLKKLLMIIGAGVGAVSFLLPWYSISLFGYSQSTNAFQMGGATLAFVIVLLICMAALIVLEAMPEKTTKKTVEKIFQSLAVAEKVIAVEIGALAVILSLSILIGSSSMGGASFGIYLLLIASIFTAVISFIKNPALDKKLGEASKKK